MLVRINEISIDINEFFHRDHMYLPRIFSLSSGMFQNTIIETLKDNLINFNL